MFFITIMRSVVCVIVITVLVSVTIGGMINISGISIMVCCY